MRQVIQEVLAAEAEAKQLIEAAHDEAERLRAEAEKQAQEAIARRRAGARGEADQMVETAVGEAQREKRAQLEKMRAAIRQRDRLDPATSEAIVQGIVRFLTGRS